MKTNLLAEALKLSIPDRVKLADEIYQSVDSKSGGVGIHPDVLAEMEQRDADYEANPGSGCTVEDLEKDMFGPLLAA